MVLVCWWLLGPVKLIIMIVLRTTKTFYSHFIHSFYAAIKAYDIKSSATQQQQHNDNNGNKKKPKYVKLTMSSKRFNMLALHVLLHSPTPSRSLSLSL